MWSCIQYMMFKFRTAGACFILIALLLNTSPIPVDSFSNPSFLFAHQGQRKTVAAPFSPRITMQLSKASILSTEEQALQEAQKHVFKKHEVPKHVHESRPLEGVRIVSTPKKPEDVFEVRPAETRGIWSQTRHSGKQKL